MDMNTRSKNGHILPAAVTVFVLSTAVPVAVQAAEAVHDDHGHGHEDASGGLPQFNPETYASQVFWLALVFVVLYAIFAKKILPDISSVLGNRKEHIQSDLDTAERLTRDAKMVQNAYERSLDKARAEAARVLAEAEQTVKDTAQTKNAEFRKKAQDDTRHLEETLAAETGRIMQDMNDMAAEITAQAVRKVVGLDIDKAKTKDVIRDLNAKKAAIKAA